MKRTAVFVFFTSAMLWAAGCGGSGGTVTGTVTFKGEPIPSGNVMFYPDSGAPMVTAPIMDGQYTAEKVPTGSAKVAITSMFFEGQPSSPMMNPNMRNKTVPSKAVPPEAQKAFEESTQMKKGVKIPERYLDPKQSGLTYTVKSGKQTKDFQLE